MALPIFGIMFLNCCNKAQLVVLFRNCKTSYFIEVGNYLSINPLPIHQPIISIFTRVGIQLILHNRSNYRSKKFTTSVSRHLILMTNSLIEIYLKETNYPLLAFKISILVIQRIAGFNLLPSEVTNTSLHS